MNTLDRTRGIVHRGADRQGIASWGCIAGVEQLDVHGSNVLYAKSLADQIDESPLEPNHTQFILVDDGSKHQNGTEIEFRSQLEKSISNEPFDQQEHAETVPVVLIVIHGGLETIRKGAFTRRPSREDRLSVQSMKAW